MEMTALMHRAGWYGLVLATLAACGRREADDTAARADSASGTAAGAAATSSDSGASTRKDTAGAPGATAADTHRTGKAADKRADTVRSHHTGTDTTRPTPPAKRVKPADRAAAQPSSSTTTHQPMSDSARLSSSAAGQAGATGAAGGQTTTTSAGAGGGVRDPYHQPARDTVSQAAYTGWKYFNLNCARCHGEDVTGTTIAPHLTESLKEGGPVNHDEYLRVVHGSRAQKGMPNWTGIIPDTTLEAIYTYVKGRAEGKIHPGRPAVKQ
jgi:mono/diheme cytochrome c family protein